MKNQKGKDNKLWFAALIILADLTSTAALCFLLGYTVFSLRIPIERPIIALSASCIMYYFAGKGLGDRDNIIVKRLSRSLMVAVLVLCWAITTELFKGKPINTTRISILVAGVAIMAANIIWDRSQKKRITKLSKPMMPNPQQTDKPLR